MYWSQRIQAVAAANERPWVKGEGGYGTAHSQVHSHFFFMQRFQRDIHMRLCPPYGTPTAFPSSTKHRIIYYNARHIRNPPCIFHIL